MEDHGDHSNTDDEEHIPREKGRPIKNNKKNKAPYLILN